MIGALVNVEFSYLDGHSEKDLNEESSPHHQNYIIKILSHFSLLASCLLSAFYVPYFKQPSDHGLESLKQARLIAK